MLEKSPREKIKLVIVEDESLYRDLLSEALSRRENLEVIGEFADGSSALEAVPGLRPDVAILDIDLRSEPNGVQVGLSLREQLPNMGVVLLSNHADTHYLTSLPGGMIGGWSYLLKKSVSNADALTRAIEGSASGFVVVDPQIVAGMQTKSGGLISRLTPRQGEILSLIAQGYTNSAVANLLVLSVKSVENQINTIYQLLEIQRTDNSVHPRVNAVLTYINESQA